MNYHNCYFLALVASFLGITTNILVININICILYSQNFYFLYLALKLKFFFRSKQGLTLDEGGRQSMAKILMDCNL
jgi:hypothetical protein